MKAALRCFPVGLGLALLGAGGAAAQERAPQPIDLPRWFAESFLDLGEGIRDAAHQASPLMCIIWPTP